VRYTGVVRKDSDSWRSGMWLCGVALKAGLSGTGRDEDKDDNKT